MPENLASSVMRQLLLLLLAPALLPAQDTTHYGSAFGLNVGIPAYAGRTIPQAATIGISWTGVRPNTIQLDAALGTSPYALGYGLPAAAARLGVVLPIALTRSTYIMPMAGASAVVVIPAAVPGWYYGGSLVSWMSESVGTRVTLTAHHFGSDDSSVMLGEIGLAWRFE
jgi:hypothetical protein